MSKSAKPGMHAVVYYSGDLDTASGLTPLTAATDSVMAKSGSTGLVPTRALEIVAAFAGAHAGSPGTLKRARISAPTLNQVFAPAIRPIAPHAYPESDPPLLLLTEHPLQVPAGEALTVLAESTTNDSLAAAVLFLRESYEPAPPGPLYILRGTNPTSGATMPVTRVWSPVNCDWDQPLPGGRYAFVWIQYVAATGTSLPIALRLVLADQVLRPGALAQPFGYSLPNRQMQDLAFGVMGTIESFAMPTCEVFQLGDADDDFEVYLGLIRLTDASGRPCRCA